MNPYKPDPLQPPRVCLGFPASETSIQSGGHTARGPTNAEGSRALRYRLSVSVCQRQRAGERRELGHGPSPPRQPPSSLSWPWDLEQSQQAGCMAGNSAASVQLGPECGSDWPGATR